MRIQQGGEGGDGDRDGHIELIAKDLALGQPPNADDNKKDLHALRQ